MSRTSDHINAAASLRRVDASLCITYQGSRWSVMQVPGACVGALVHVWPAPQAGVLCAASASAGQQGTLAAWMGPAHSPLHMCKQCCTQGSCGSLTTSHAPAHQCSCPEPHVQRTPQAQQVAMNMAHTRSRTCGTAHVALAADSISTGQAAELAWTDTPRCGMTGTGRERASSGSLVGCGCACCPALYETSGVHP